MSAAIQVERWMRYRLPSGALVAVVSLTADGLADCIYVTETGSVWRRRGGVEFNVAWLGSHAKAAPWIPLSVQVQHV